MMPPKPPMLRKKRNGPAFSGSTSPERLRATETDLMREVSMKDHPMLSNQSIGT
jgi:hypothetical protein